jgi:hypothetical protein
VIGQETVRLLLRPLDCVAIAFHDWVFTCLASASGVCFGWRMYQTEITP